MPVAHFHLPVGAATPDQERRLLTEAAAAYSRVLDSPIERVRTFLVHYDPAHLTVAGELVAESGVVAPYFTAIVLAGRSVKQRQQLLAAFTDLIVDVLDVDRAGVREQIIEVDPDNWGIAGRPALGARASEIAARAGTP
jgi:4-oxalocrotonate tautomerase family enzyme